jgi:hypothetical protein
MGGKKKARLTNLKLVKRAFSARGEIRTPTPVRHHPLKMACLPVSPRAQNWAATGAMPKGNKHLQSVQVCLSLHSGFFALILNYLIPNLILLKDQAYLIIIF